MPFTPESATLVTFSLAELLNSSHLVYVRFAAHRSATRKQNYIPMKTAELTELTASEMETVSGGFIQNGTRKPKLRKLIFLLLLLLKKHGDSAPRPEPMQEADTPLK
jgi:hypothetical protein